MRKSLCTLLASASILAGCASTIFLAGCASTMATIPPVPAVDLAKFMGDWYVIACIPTFIETQAYNAVESYQLEPDGTINTRFRFNKASFTGELKSYNPHGFVVPNTGNAVWGMQFIWPIKSEYIIADLSPNYSTTIIARNARDYVWIMARSPIVAEDEYQALVQKVARLGYDTQRLRKVPQQVK
jgi:apolipoprotein D and lipocalin family protein